MKRCSKCGTEKPLSEYYAHPRGKNGRYAGCKDCTRAVNDLWRILNPERKRAASRRHYEANRAVYIERARLWGESNKEVCAEGDRRYREANRSKVNAAVARWERAHPERHAAKEQGRRARKAAAPGRGVTPEQWLAVLAESLGLCAYCNERKPLTMDHIEPLRRGGAHDDDNICAACRSCNSGKSDTPLLVWLALNGPARANQRMEL